MIGRAKIIAKGVSIAAITKPNTTSLTAEQLEHAIASISEALKGTGIGMMERICMHEDRKAYRADLAKRRQS